MFRNRFIICHRNVLTNRIKTNEFPFRSASKHGFRFDGEFTEAKKKNGVNRIG